MKNMKISSKNTPTTETNKTIVLSIDKGNSWSGSVTSGSSNIQVKVNILSGLFSRGDSLSPRRAK